MLHQKKSKKNYALLVAILFISLVSFKRTSKSIVRDDLKRYYDAYKVNGSFILFNENEDTYTYYNQSQTQTPFTPASTFKICNSLIALENGTVDNEHVVLKWDGKERQLPVWNKDTDMKEAFKSSTVWYYQELARRTGNEKMQYWLNKAKYGNADMTGGIDAFWLTGNLRISPFEQIEFLKKLHDDQLPFSKRSMHIVKDIMINKDTLGCIIRGKLGAGKQNEQYVGWYVGYVTTKTNTYYFSNCIQSLERVPDFNAARTNIVYDVLKELNVLK
jgi:beta-lactamase class D